MFGFIKRFFNKSCNEELLKKEIEKLKRENERLKDNLEWYHSIGIPSHEVFEDGFDYYNHLKNQILELKMDKEYMEAQLVEANKELKKNEVKEKMYLEEIAKLKLKIEQLSLAKANIDLGVFVKDDEVKIIEDTEKDNNIVEKNIENESKPKEEKSPLREAAEIVKKMSKDKFYTYV